MKLYTIINTDTNEIIAISEYKYHIYDFYIQNNYDPSIYSIKKIKDKGTINDYLILFSDLYIEELHDFVVLNKDLNILSEIINGEITRVYDAISLLKDVSKNVTKTKDSDIIYKTICILKKGLKSDNITEIIDIRTIIYEYYNIPEFQQLGDIYNLFIQHMSIIK